MKLSLLVAASFLSHALTSYAALDEPDQVSVQFSGATPAQSFSRYVPTDGTEVEIDSDEVVSSITLFTEGFTCFFIGSNHLLMTVSGTEAAPVGPPSILFLASCVTDDLYSV
ncbi:Hypothetical protein PENO1_107200 [Penicillium occitanis (nom. inval.)]|nr:Hypothetical protein PENO1_107200 [Penicillium occitanis (nom. inval.)]PCG89168.1 hypothetical protein PENOC_107740 [Penicillium occitanis (nom. inval.)]